MKKYRLEAGGVVDTDKAVSMYDLDIWDGHNYQCGGVGLHQVLYKSPRGQWYVRHWSQWEGAQDSVELLTELEAYNRLIQVFSVQKIESDFSAEFLAAQADAEL